MRLKKFLNFLLNRKEEESIEIPDHIEIVFTRKAVDNGTLDDYNKEILVIREKFVVERTPYSIRELWAMQKIYNLPIWDRTSEEEDDFIFAENLALSGSMIETREI